MSDRWANLWWPSDFAEDLACSSGEEDGKLSPAVFVENLLLFIGALLLIFLVHITVISIVEATWLSKVKNK